jgi:hypothetical protein
MIAEPRDYDSHLIASLKDCLVRRHLVRLIIDEDFNGWLSRLREKPSYHLLRNGSLDLEGYFIHYNFHKYNEINGDGRNGVCPTSNESQSSGLSSYLGLSSSISMNKDQ